MGKPSTPGWNRNSKAHIHLLSVDVGQKCERNRTCVPISAVCRIEVLLAIFTDRVLSTLWAVIGKERILAFVSVFVSGLLLLFQDFDKRCTS